MAKWGKIFLGTSIGAGIIALTSYVMRLKKTGAALETVSKISIHSVNLQGITIRIDSVLKNPSATTVKLKYPFVKLIYNNSTIGTSQSIDKDITLPANGEANINAIMIKVPIGGLLSAGIGMYKQYLNKEPIPITIKTTSTIDLGWKKLPYENTEQKTLNQNANAANTSTPKTDPKKPATKKTAPQKNNDQKNKTKKS